MSLGDIVDQAVRAWRRNFIALFKLFLALQLVQYGLAKVIDPQESLRMALQSGPSASQWVKTFAPTVLLLLVILLTSWVASMVGGALVVNAVLHGKADLSSALARLRTRAGTLLLAYCQSLLGFVGVLLVPLLPVAVVLWIVLQSPSKSPLPWMVLAVWIPLIVLFALVFIVIWLMVRLMLVPLVIAEEGGSAWAAVKRAGQLVSGRVALGLLGRSGFRASLLLTLGFAVLLGVGVIASLPSLILQFIYANPFTTTVDASQVIPPYLLVPAELFQTLLSSVFAPISASLSALFYLDQRMRQEGLDLELRLNALRPAP